METSMGCCVPVRHWANVIGKPPNSTKLSSVIVRQDGTYRLSDAFIRLVDSIQLRISMNGEAHMITGVSDVNNYRTYYYAAFIAMMVVSMSGDDSSFDICDCGRIADFLYPSGDWCLYRMLSYSDGNEQNTSSAQNGKAIDVSVMCENWHPCDASDIADVDGLTDLTVLAETEGLGSNVVARDDEFEQLISVLIRKDGLFVLDELKCLNPENLLSEDA